MIVGPLTPTDDPADVFVRLFDAVPEGLFLGDEAAKLGQDEAVLKEADLVEEKVLATGRADPDLSRLPVRATRNATAYARLIGLDRVLRRAHPGATAPAPRALQHIAVRYASKGRFNTTAVPGLLLPRLVPYGAPLHRADKYEAFSVVRLEPHRMTNVRFITLGPSTLPTYTGDDSVTVACVPFLDTAADVELRRVDKFGKARYRLGPHDGPELDQRVDEAIAALDGSGAIIGMLPEGSLSARLLEVWKRRLRATYLNSQSPLALVIAGSGPVIPDEPPPNRAVVLDRCGLEIWQQDKLCDYTLVSDTTKNWHLDGLGDGDLLEDITRGSELVVVETPAGRLAILICEDLQRCETRNVVPRNLGVSHLFTPVFDAPLSENRWERFAAERHLNWGGSRVAVANSRVIRDLREDGEEMVTALAVAPPRDEGSWDYSVQAVSTRSPTQAAVLRLPPIGPPP